MPQSDSLASEVHFEKRQKKRTKQKNIYFLEEYLIFVSLHIKFNNKTWFISKTVMNNFTISYQYLVDARLLRIQFKITLKYTGYTKK